MSGTITQKRPRLGELLIQNGLINADQLESALSSQVVNAGRLGSNVVEMGVTSVDAVGELLSFQLGVPAAGPSQLSEIDPQILAIVPAEVCGKYRLLPFAVLGRSLHLAMLDPLRRDVLDYLAKGLRAEIKPFVVPQLRLLYLLERHYGIARPKRFLRAPAKKEDSRRNYLAPTVTVKGGSETPVASPQKPPAQPQPGSITAEFGLVYLDEVDKSAPAEEAEADRFDFEVDVAFDQPEADQAEGPATVETVIARLDKAETREDLVRGLVTPVVPGTALSLLLLPRGELAVGLAAWGTERSPDQVRSLVVPLNTPSFLQRALKDNQVVHGPAADDSLQAMIATYLAVPLAGYSCMLPISIGARVANLVCVQSSEPFDEAGLESLGRIAASAEAAYMRLIQSQKAGA